MKKIIYSIILITLCALTVSAQRPVQKSKYTLLKNATLIDVNSGEGKKGDLLIKDEIIETINYNNEIVAPKGTITYDLEGTYIIPGLIDGHVHITHGTYEKAQKDLYNALMSGITSMRDMGGDARILTALKRNNEFGEVVGADVYFSTIIAGPEFFANDPRPQMVSRGGVAGKVPWQLAVTHNSDLKEIITSVKATGATAIKIYDSVDKDLFKKVAKEAKRQGLKVWSHAVVPPTTALNVTNGGSEVMSHAGNLVKEEFVKGKLKKMHEYLYRDKEAMAYKKMLKDIQWNENDSKVKKLFSAMKKNNSILDATLIVYTMNLGHTFKGFVPDSTDFKNAVKTVRIAHKNGVKIGAGSDIMTNERGFYNLHNELKLLVKAGLSNLEALRSATIINAEALGEEKRLGSIEEGKIANLVILNRNPLDKIRYTSSVKAVIKRGKYHEKIINH